MKHTITSLFALGMAATLSACGVSLDSESVMRIEMYGSSTVPASATGDKNPSFQNYILKSIGLVSAAGTTNLLDSEDSYKIIDRAQLLYEKDMSNFKGNEYTGISITFGPAVTGGNAKQSDLSFTLSNETISLVKTFTIQSAKSITFSIEAHWGNTLADGVMTEPEFEIVGP